MQRLAALVPRPRLHLIRFHGVLASNAKLCSGIVPGPLENTSEHAAHHAHGAPARMSWARLLKRGLAAAFSLSSVFWSRTLPELWRRPEDHRRPFDKLRTGVEDPAVIAKILTHIWACPRAPARPLALFQAA
ncbi:MAG: hypothetical protein ABL878_08670 [Burkholderiales bacterium]